MSILFKIRHWNIKIKIKIHRIKWKNIIENDKIINENNHLTCELLNFITYDFNHFCEKIVSSGEKISMKNSRKLKSFVYIYEILLTTINARNKVLT